MPFDVAEFHELVQLLQARPEWRAELRRLLLTEDVLGLPARIDALTAAVAELREAQRQAAAELAEQRKQTDARFAELAAEVRALTEAQRRSEARLERVETDIETLKTDVATLKVDVGTLKGSDEEQRHAWDAPALFRDLLKRVRALSKEEVAGWLEAAEDSGRLTDLEVAEVLRADVFVSGRDRASGEALTLVVEVSWGVGAGDVERAMHRAALLSKAGHPARAVVAGRSITAEARRQAQERDVAVVLAGRLLKPSAA